jgi:hypothetical protein
MTVTFIFIFMLLKTVFVLKFCTIIMKGHGCLFLFLLLFFPVVCRHFTWAHREGLRLHGVVFGGVKMSVFIYLFFSLTFAWNIFLRNIYFIYFYLYGFSAGICNITTIKSGIFLAITRDSSVDRF